MIGYALLAISVGLAVWLIWDAFRNPNPISRSPSKCVACDRQLGQPHLRDCPLKRFT